MTQAAITKRIWIHGTLHLDSPLLIGSGASSDGQNYEVDSYVVKDKHERPFIPGTSLAGVLRSLLEAAYPQAALSLFGHISATGEADEQSAVTVWDIALDHTTYTLRDGVSIDPFTGTTIQGAKYDYEAVERGATGALNLYITLRQIHAAQDESLMRVIEALTDQLAQGIRLGALTAKGFGRVSCRNVQADIYDFHKAADVTRWLTDQPASTVYHGKANQVLTAEDFTVTASFALKSSLLVRNRDVTEDDRDAHIHAVPMTSGGDYLIPGTTVKGVLRHRAAYILRRMGKNLSLLDDLMGYSMPEKKKKSRFVGG